ncbi:MAG: DUF4870 domain-containing protein [Candidatus Micrarchaeota archaeon]
MASSASNDSNLMGAVAYLLFTITGVILYLAKPEDKYVRYHAIQSAILGVVLWVISMILGIAIGATTMATLGTTAIIGIMIMGLMQLVFFVIWIFCMWQAYSGKKFKIPVIGDLAEKNA